MAIGGNDLASLELPIRHGSIELPEQNDESVDLNEHADDGVAQEDDDDAAEEGRRALDLLPLEEEPEGPLQADDESEAAQKQDLENKPILVNQKPGRSVPSDTVVFLMTKRLQENVSIR